MFFFCGNQSTSNIGRMMVLPFKQLVLVDLLQKTLGFQPVGLVQQLEYLDKCVLVNMEKDIWDIYIYCRLLQEKQNNHDNQVVSYITNLYYESILWDIYMYYRLSIRWLGNSIRSSFASVQGIWVAMAPNRSQPPESQGSI